MSESGFAWLIFTSILLTFLAFAIFCALFLRAIQKKRLRRPARDLWEAEQHPEHSESEFIALYQLGNRIQLRDIADQIIAEVHYPGHNKWIAVESRGNGYLIKNSSRRSSFDKAVLSYGENEKSCGNPLGEYSSSLGSRVSDGRFSFQDGTKVEIKGRIKHFLKDTYPIEMNAEAIGKIYRNSAFVCAVLRPTLNEEAKLFVLAMGYRRFISRS